MKTATKKLISIFCISSLIFTTSIANAEINQQNLVGTTLVSAGALATFMTIAGGAAAVIGTGGVALAAVGVAILIGNNTNSSSTTSSEPISIRLNPNTPLITPAGWSNPTTPPSSTSLVQQWSYASPALGPDTAQNVCQSLVDHLNSQSTQGVVFSNKGVSGTNNTNCKVGRIQNGTPLSDLNYQLLYSGACPTGYTNQSGVCNLTNASIVVKPKSGVHEVKRVGNTFVQDSQANPADVLPSEVMNVTSDEITVNDATGKKTTISINPDGTSSVEVSTPQTDGTTQKFTANMSTPDPTTGDVTVTGTSTTIVQGTGDLETGTPPPALDISSLNKEATQQGIKSDTAAINANTANIKDNVQIITDEITNSSNNDTTLDAQKTDFDAIAQAHNDAVANIGTSGLTSNGWSWSWSPVIPTGTCVPFSHTFMGNAITMDYCDGVYKARDLAGWLFYILTAMSIFSISTGRRE